MRVAVLGAGVAGLVAAYRLTEQGHEPVVFERWPGLGGMAATLDVGGGHLLERYYHHWFTSDRHIVDLCEELGVGPIEWRPSSMAFFVDGKSRAFTTPLDLLRFTPLSLRDRIRMGVAVLKLQRAGRPTSDYEGETAAAWIRREMGEGPWQKVWGPLLRGKFGSRAEDISMAWLHGKLTLRRKLEGKEARKELLGYPAPSFEPIWTELVKRIEAGGGQVRIDQPAARVSREADGTFVVTPAAPGSFRKGHDPRDFDPAGEAERFDAVIATVPNDIFLSLADPSLGLADDFLEKLRTIEYHTALCLLLELQSDKVLSPFYWTNVADTDVPFVGLIEHTNFLEPERYDGRRFLYVANYLEPGDELLSLDPDQLVDRYLPHLQKVNPAFSRDWVVDRWMFREPAAQPIVIVGYHETIPPLDTGIPGLVLANTTQIYPEDRGTNYSVRLGEDAVKALLSQPLAARETAPSA
ncbi:NAD(P)/FAD-dependent oxidoreductase [Conexibacter sp. SYSU D00693]|uniref:NAD(P)/FAD-dependent oxidoreductase n=1 Tax=Conexibacter sp. SYSU D00693 TaxID=2812560 RepID=UPI00196B4F94|nr:NAD(P)/FAD-dependent oxidoreductase [Conexibacter sp. SYSU D00693]